MNITISLRRNSNIVRANMFVKSKIRKQEKKKKRNTVRSLDRQRFCRTTDSTRLKYRIRTKISDLVKYKPLLNTGRFVTNVSLTSYSHPSISSIAICSPLMRNINRFPRKSTRRVVQIYIYSRFSSIVQLSSILSSKRTSSIATPFGGTSIPLLFPRVKHSDETGIKLSPDSRPAGIATFHLVPFSSLLS